MSAAKVPMEPAGARGASARARWPKRLGLVLLSLVAADVLVGLTLLRGGLLFDRPVAPFGPTPHPRQAAWLEAPPVESGIGRFDRLLGWSWRPSSQSEDGRFRINSLGARGEREYPEQAEAGVLRMAFFGDSFTFGDEIQGTGTFQWLLEHRHRHVEAINLGVSGFGTDQALLRYRDLGRGLGAQVVGIGILLENIGRNVNRYRPMWNTSTGFCAAKPRFLLQADGSLELLPQPYASEAELRASVASGAVLEETAAHEHWTPARPPGPLRYSAFARLFATWRAYAARSSARMWNEPEEEPFRVTVALLERFHAEAIADGARLAPVLVFPTRGDLAHYLEHGEGYWQPLITELERRGVPVIDLVPALARREEELREEADPTRTLWYGGHLSSVGNAVVAKELWAWIEAHGDDLGQ